MYSYLSLFLLNFKIFFKRKFGFRKNNLALIDLVDLIAKYLNNDYYVCRVFIDLQMAFGNVNHDILLDKVNIMISVDWLITD